MRSLFLIAIVGLFWASDLVSASTETKNLRIESDNTNNDSNELHYVDRDVQSRRENWDLFGFMLMMLNSECAGPKAEVHLPDCRTLQRCRATDTLNYQNYCDTLCGMADKPGKSKYEKFCYPGDSTTTTASSNSNVDSYNGNSTPGSFVSGGAYSARFNLWMVAVALSVGMAMVAIHIGQRRKDYSPDEDAALVGVTMQGSVGRRVDAVAHLMDGVLSSDRTGQQVELAEYSIENSPSYESAVV